MNFFLNKQTKNFFLNKCSQIGLLFSNSRDSDSRKNHNDHLAVRETDASRQSKGIRFENSHEDTPWKPSNITIIRYRGAYEEPSTVPLSCREALVSFFPSQRVQAWEKMQWPCLPATFFFRPIIPRKEAWWGSPPYIPQYHTAVMFGKYKEGS